MNNQEDELEDKKFEEAVNDFKSRLIVIQLPKEENKSFTRYVQRMSGVDCILALINEEQKTVTPLPDEFNAPYADIELWKIAMQNSKEKSYVNEEVSNPEQNIYVISSPCMKAIISVDKFWDELCHTLGCMRLIVSFYCEEENTIVVASGVPNKEDMVFRTYIRNANKEDRKRISYVYVRNVGMLSEAALNSKD